MPFITDTQLTQHVESILKKGSLPSGMNQVISLASTAAYNEILARLVGRGYTKAQVDTWARGAEFQLDIGAFWVLTKNAMLDEFDDKGLIYLDRREELDSVYLLDADGEPIDLEEGAGAVGYGDMVRDDQVFTISHTW